MLSDVWVIVVCSVDSVVECGVQARPGQPHGQPRMNS